MSFFSFSATRADVFHFTSSVCVCVWITRPLSGVVSCRALCWFSLAFCLFCSSSLPQTCILVCVCGLFCCFLVFCISEAMHAPYPPATVTRLMLFFQNKRMVSLLPHNSLPSPLMTVVPG